MQIRAPKMATLTTQMRRNKISGGNRGNLLSSEKNMMSGLCLCRVPLFTASFLETISNTKHSQFFELYNIINWCKCNEPSFYFFIGVLSSPCVETESLSFSLSLSIEPIFFFSRLMGPLETIVLSSKKTVII